MRPTPELTISSDPDLIDWPWVHRELKGTYWGNRYTISQLVYAAKASTVYGAYATGGRQVGFARIVTDHIIFSSLMDVLVDENWRGMGIGTEMMKQMMKTSAIQSTICILASRDAKSFYRRFGFVDIGGNVMQRDPK